MIPIHHYRDFAPEARYTTPEMVRLEREVMERVCAGRAMVSPIAENVNLSRYSQLADNPKQQEILRAILATKDQVVALQGTAGSAKSTAAGMHLIRARSQDPAARSKTFYMLDEASLASTKQMRAFLDTLGARDHVLLIGDDDPNPRKVGQHISIEAGRLFQKLQESSMKTAQLNRIYRQKDPELKQVVLELRHGLTQEALHRLAGQQRINEYANSKERYAAIANVISNSRRARSWFRPTTNRERK